MYIISIIITITIIMIVVRDCSTECGFFILHDTCT